jgi:AcrR family transcriptional regulator
MKRVQPLRRTQAERSRASREKIIQNAIEAFAQKGFRGATMAEIARAAGLTEPGLLHHFPGKTHLLMEVLRERDRLDTERMQETLRKNGDRLLEAAQALVKHNQSVPGLVQLFTLLVAESISPDHPAHEFFIERYRRGRDAWVEAIARAQQAGEIRSDISPEVLAIVIFAMMDGLQVQWLLEPEKINMSGAFRQFVALLKPQ